MTSQPQLRMVWPEIQLSHPPIPNTPAGYTLRTAGPEDHEPFFALMASAGWPGWDQERLAPWVARLLPQGWFVAVHRATGALVGTAMALQDCSEFGEPGGELGWVASDPRHRGKGLGRAISAAATACMIDYGYRFIHLYTEDWRMPALKLYLTLGYVPFLDRDGATARWQAICHQLAMPFRPQLP